MRAKSVHEDHDTFRSILNAMSRPGTVCRLPHAEPGDAGRLLAEALGCLLDNEVSVCVLDDQANEIAGALRRTTGCRAAPLEEAEFVVACRATSNDLLCRMKRGTLEYPDGGATVVYLVDRASGDGGRFSLSGPGIETSCRPAFAGLADSELVQLREINAEFPLGVDALFLDRSGSIVCIPRSTRIGEN